VHVRDFYISKTEVTFAEYDVFCFATQRPRLDDKTWGRGKRPAIFLEWYDAIEYCNWRSKVDGLDTVYSIKKEAAVPRIEDSDQKQWEVTANWSANGYRLPREVEWEYAARERGKNVRFGNGKSIANTDQLNFNGLKEPVTGYSLQGEYRKKTVEVGSLNAPNALGLHDMTGNVFEWCWESYTESYRDFFTANSMQYPTTPGRGRTRVARGGAWSSEPDMCRNAYRHYWQPAAKLPDVGFRLARSSK
jgi:sulfatase modifying factor 1